ncbi:MAG: 30S ribosomal protein S13 [Dehalococcoidia bacterium]|nr:30S ribosomal protein S13 [Dehalococcoidia bacterium]
MARIAGVDIGKDKQIWVALQYIQGIGRTSSLNILKEVGVDAAVKVNDLTDDEVNRIRELVSKSYIVEGDLKKVTTLNIKRLMEIGSYRGLRHRRGLPVRGQRTKTNARTKRGRRVAVAGRGKRRGTTKK